MADDEMELALRQPLRKPPYQLFPSLYQNGEPSSKAFGLPPAVETELDPTVMMLLTNDKEEIEAGKIFTQCDRIKESNVISLSQYFELLRRIRHNRLLDSSENNVNKKLVDITPYVLLLRRLSSKLVQFYPRNDYTRDTICTYSDPSYCLISYHIHLCPYVFLENLGCDLLHTNKLILGLEDPSEENGLQVTTDVDVCIDNLLRVLDLLKR